MNGINIDKKMKDITILDFKALRISLASSKDILEWSYGEVTKPETINYRTLRPEKDGLFDERIFGPTKDWECYCGKYKRIRYRGIVCDKCGVEVTLSRVRRERMGHINLATPVAHVWFFKGSSSPLSLLLDMSQKSLESVIYYASYLVISIDEEKKKQALDSFSDYIEKKKQQLKQELSLEGKKVEEEMEQKKKEALGSKSKIEQGELIEQEIELTKRQKTTVIAERLDQESKKLDEIYDALLKLLKGLRIGAVLSEDEYFKILEYDIPVFFTIRTGAEGLLELLEKIDIAGLIASLRKEAEKAKGQKYLKLIKRLRLIESIRKAEIMPSFMLLSVLPVIPPDLRPMVQLSGGRFATSDLNDLYRRVINRNNRLKHLMSLGAPQIILKNERRMLQEAVDSLIDIAQRSSQVTSSPLRSLSDMLRGKQGRFRQNLLGKRVDYSGRSVIVVGPQLTLSQCGLPKEMALEMFKPFVLREVIIRGFAPNIKSAKRFIEKRPPEVFDILEEITKNHPVLLNRAPTLHKLGIQAFYPILIEGSAIALHPCVCAGYNADFDGDQMAVHIPLSKKAQEEAITLMMPKQNLLKPADGGAITLPNKEMAVGIYYLTSIDESLRKEELPMFRDMQDALLTHNVKTIQLREPIMIRIEDKNEETTVGRILLNEALPKSFGFINKSINASGIKTIVTEAITKRTPDEVENLIDAIKKLGFYGATVSGISVSVFDNEMIPERTKFIHEADKKIILIEEDYQKGLITDEERKRLSNDIWLKVTDIIADLTWNNLKSTNVIKLIIDSEGARAGKEQLKQLSAMKGLILDPLGKIVELPIKSNFREGLSIFEYVASARGSRKGLTDSALKTANAGYLTRRLVDCSHDVIIRKEDCGTKEGIILIKDEKDRTTPFLQRILGRVSAGNVYSLKTKKIIAKAQEEITVALAKKIVDNEVSEVIVRSAITCELEYGICVKCYGWDFSTRKTVEQGVPVGVIAAQSIGEPGTQLTMRVRHFGGVVMSDVTQGLPRVEELFEMRTPKALSPIAEFMGKIKLETTDDGYLVTIKSTKIKPAQELEYFIPLTAALNVKDGDEVLPGVQLAQGYVDPKEMLKIKGLTDAQRYVILEAQKVYESQGIAINDKHFEVVLRKMSDKVVVETVGDTSLIPGAFITKTKFQDINSGILSQGGEPATARQTILGITKSALYSDSWLSASSFQETTKVLTEAALEGRVDNLIGLKENVIIGRLIPVEGKTSSEV
ncbi:MAG: DNA-directed RNA polymerase subunit beta' [Candidatus Levybacteria bacterium GW2011_GWA2_37_36]|nr:MAG: DNA-directed RNA polymerase subunit beta' [Candidatus Levybacteria bacterium GW2011_GWA1_37_16]KKQ33951.1 MAG: DNA-directed RNA polymerase subunit beta' [Candidatus Levybacteria bacterium GW2011_GWA2_37_36]KKQ38404.1 MAG: DNA-directed RNA polymerase subunit beta' [Candidatus Levybacteria bacterium GW2011_GWC2_37_7]KKQ42217.1 MAG: DNA-directed RNA polymerase subunit beta' [Candidatus Levybacteria bacterium GW2011_GWB1_37_8]OGH51175.1 MAG: DNA-directed RNA polymerase subunit beta' [Candid